MIMSSKLSSVISMMIELIKICLHVFNLESTIKQNFLVAPVKAFYTVFLNSS